MPMTMLGTPERTSAMKRTVRPTVPSPRSARNTPAPMPTGSPKTHAKPTMYSVPTRALPMPPPGSPTGFGNAVKKSQERPAAPLLMTR